MFENFKIRNQAEEPEAVIEIVGDIGEPITKSPVQGAYVTQEDIINQLRPLKGRPIRVKIATLGGNLLEALTIHDVLRMHDAPVTTEIIGATASAGTIIAMAGQMRNITQNVPFLIHQSQGGAKGNYTKLLHEANELVKMDGIMSSIYSKATGKGRPELLALMEEERWLTADEAKEWGFVHNILDSPAILNDYRIKQFSELFNIKEHITNKQILNTMTEEETKKMEELEATISDLQAKLAEYEEKEMKAAEEKEEDEAEEVVENAIKAGRLTATLKDKFKAMYKADKEGTTQILNELPEPQKRIITAVKNDPAPAAMTPETWQKNWKEGKYTNNMTAGRKDFEAAYKRKPNF